MVLILAVIRDMKPRGSKNDAQTLSTFLLVGVKDFAKHINGSNWKTISSFSKSHYSLTLFCNFLWSAQIVLQKRLCRFHLILWFRYFPEKQKIFAIYYH